MPYIPGLDGHPISITQPLLDHVVIRSEEPDSPLTVGVTEKPALDDLFKSPAELTALMTTTQPDVDEAWLQAGIRESLPKPDNLAQQVEQEVEDFFNTFDSSVLAHTLNNPNSVLNNPSLLNEARIRLLDSQPYEVNPDPRNSFYVHGWRNVANILSTRPNLKYASYDIDQLKNDLVLASLSPDANAASIIGLQTFNAMQQIRIYDGGITFVGLQPKQQIYVLKLYYEAKLASFIKGVVRACELGLPELGLDMLVGQAVVKPDSTDIEKALNESLVRIRGQKQPEREKAILAQAAKLTGEPMSVK